MSEILFVINPVSGRGISGDEFAGLHSKLLDHGIDFREHMTTGPGDATSATRYALESGVRGVVAVGGDGTLNEVVNGYLSSSGEPVNREAFIGLLPNGTGSDFNRTLGFKSVAESLNAIAEGETLLLDAGEISFFDENGCARTRAFINLASFGLGAETVDRANRWRHSLPGWLGGRVRFGVAAIAALRSYRLHDAAVRLDDCSTLYVQTNLIAVGNAKFAGGGMMLSPNSDLTDGCLNLVITDRATTFDVIKELPRIHRGGLLRNPRVSEHRVKTVRIDGEDHLPIEVDGEVIGKTPASIRVLPRVIRFAVTSLPSHR